MVHSTRAASDFRKRSVGFFPALLSRLSARRRCDYCERWIVKGAVAVRCPGCERVYHDECLRKRGCGVSVAALRRSRRTGAPVHWTCGNCDSVTTVGTEIATCNFGAQAARGYPQPTETPLPVAGFYGPKRLNFETVSTSSSSSAAPLVTPAHKQLDRKHSVEVGLAGGLPIGDGESEDKGRQGSNVTIVPGAHNTLRGGPINANFATSATKKKRVAFTHWRSPFAPSVTPAPKRICKQTNSISRSAMILRSGRRVVPPRQPRRATAFRLQLRAARKERAKLVRAQSATCANGSFDSFAAAAVTDTTNDAAMPLRHQLHNPGLVVDDAGINKTATCAQQACRERFEALEAKLERIIAGLRDSFRAEILSLHLAQQQIIHQNAAASEHRKLLTSKIDNFDDRLKKIRINDKIIDANFLEHDNSAAHFDEEGKQSNFSASGPNLGQPINSGTTAPLYSTSKITVPTSTDNILSSSNIRSATLGSPNNLQIEKQIQAIAGSSRKCLANSAAACIIKASQRKPHDYSILNDESDDDKDRIAIICGDSHLRQIIKPIKKITRPLNEELAFHCEERLSLDAALKNAAELVNVAIDADLKVVILAGLSDIMQGNHPHQTIERIVNQIVDFAHFCRAKCVDLTVCSIPVISGTVNPELTPLIQEANTRIRSALHELSVDFLDLSVKGSGVLSNGVQFAPGVRNRVALKIGHNLCRFLKRDPQPFTFASNSKYWARSRVQVTRLPMLSTQLPTSPTTMTKQPPRRPMGFHQTSSTARKKPNIKKPRHPLLEEDFGSSNAVKGRKQYYRVSPKHQRLHPASPFNTRDQAITTTRHPLAAHQSIFHDTHYRPREFQRIIHPQNTRSLLQTFSGRLDMMQSMLDNVLQLYNQPPRAV